MVEIFALAVLIAFAAIIYSWWRFFKFLRNNPPF